MNKYMKIAHELMKVAKEISASGIMLENPNAPKYDKQDLPILGIEVTESDIKASELYKTLYGDLQKEFANWKKDTCRLSSGNQEAQEYLSNLVDYSFDEESEIDEYVMFTVKDVVDSLKELAKKKITYMSGNFADWSEYYDMQPMENAQDVLKASAAAFDALGTFGFTYNFVNMLDDKFFTYLKEDIDGPENNLSEEAKEAIKKDYL